MSERRERTAQEREAARREREARRAARRGEPAPPPDAFFAPPAAQPPVAPPQVVPAPPAAPPPVAPAPPSVAPAVPEPLGGEVDARRQTGDHGRRPFVTGDHELVPVGATRPESKPMDTSEHEPEREPMETGEHHLDPLHTGEYDAGDMDTGEHDAGALETGEHDVQFARDAEGEYEAPAGIRRVVRTSSGETIERPTSADAGAPRRRPRWGLRALAVLAVALAAAFIWFMVELWQPFHGTPGAPITVTIAKTDTAGQIGDQLARQGVIPSSFFFQARAMLAGDRGKLLAGTYHLRRDMSYGTVLTALTTPPPPIPTTDLTIVEGKSRRQIDALLRSQGIRGSYRLATLHSPLLNPATYGAPRSTPSLEGFLYPSTYTLRKPVSIHVLVHKQLQAFKHAFATVDMRYARSKHLTPYDVLIIASIIEKEAATSHDRPLVASVIYNRLKAHMPLGMDSTTRYEFNNYTTPLTASQLAANSPYNTRNRDGLPPTPIGNPGLAAIAAAAHPANTNYYYFVVKPCGNGASVFSSDYQKFLSDSARYQNARAARGGRSPENC